MKKTNRNTCHRVHLCSFAELAISPLSLSTLLLHIPFKRASIAKLTTRTVVYGCKNQFEQQKNLVKYISKNRIHVTRRKHDDDRQTKCDINNECISFALPLVNKRQKYSSFAIDRRSAIVVRNNKFSFPIKFVFPSAYLKSQWFTLKNGFIRH